MSRRRRQQQEDVTRRDFLRCAACAAVGTSSLISTVWDLRMVNAAVGLSRGGFTDYKALVCLFLYGGNDANNLIVPTGAFYPAYAAARQNLALPDAGQTGGVLPINPLNGDGRTWGFHPSCQELVNLFNTGKLGLVCNTGTLVEPLNGRPDYQNPAKKKPPQLFSHNDQQVQWQTSIPDQQSQTGWGGRCADMIHANANPDATVSMSITVGGTNTFEVGSTINQYAVNSSGTVRTFNGGGLADNAARIQLMRDLFGDGLIHPNLFVQAFSGTMKRADDNAQVMGDVFNNTINPPLGTVFPNSSLGNQLRTIARMIKGRTLLSHNRQIFFASVGGYDTHGDQLVAHNNLLNELSEALNAFYNATVELGLSDKITTFTASDFGRTYPSNGGGSDHGWGSHQIVMGDAVIGQKLYGTMPDLVVGGNWDTGLGRWIPSTSVDEYSATIAKWFGVNSSDLITIFPNLARFATPDMGFLTTK
jgi:uncharacterized protein (DUF1501 family)